MFVLGLAAAKRDNLGAFVERIGRVEPLGDEFLLADQFWLMPNFRLEVKCPQVIQIASMVAFAADDDHKSSEQCGCMVGASTGPQRLVWPFWLGKCDWSTKQRNLTVNLSIVRQFELDNVVELSFGGLSAAKEVN